VRITTFIVLLAASASTAIAQTAPPPNDACTDCAGVLTGVPYHGHTQAATGTDVSSCAFNDFRDAWNCWTADCTGRVSITTCGSSFDTTLAVYDACGGHELVCDDDLCPAAPGRSKVTLDVTEGTTYSIRVAGYKGASGDYTLNVETCKNACCLTNGVCGLATLSQCAAVGGTPLGPGSVCRGDLDNNGIDDACEPRLLQLGAAPQQQTVGLAAGATGFTVLNAGSGTMNWMATVIQGSSWLRLTAGSSGINGGIVLLAYDANPNTDIRVGKIRVIAPGATPSAVDFTLTQSGTAPPPGASATHFTFNDLPLVQTVDAPFAITLTARDANGDIVTSYAGRVDLSAGSGLVVAPRYVTLAQGTATANVSIDQQTMSATLTATAGSLRGTSASFEVRGPAGVPTSRLEGLVQAGNPPAPVAEGNVFLTFLDGTHNQAVQVDSSGRYAFTDWMDVYTVFANSGGGTSDRVRVALVTGQTVTRDLIVHSDDKPPVLLVGGIMASTLRTHSEIYPYLGNSTARDRSELKLLDPYGTVWTALKNRLRGEFLVLDVPWDWRQKIDDWFITHQLLPAIDAAKAMCNPPCEKVNVVAHSLGGILVRRYIQSELYGNRNDIDRLAMCGTPSRGAAIAYYIWEGGDPQRADDIQEPWFPTLGLINYYRNTFENLYNGVYGIPGTHSDSTPAVLFDARDISPAEGRSFLQTYVEGLGDLMPTFKFLNRNGVLGYWSDYQQSTLWELEHSPLIARLVEDSPGTVGIHTKVFLSDKEDTVLEIPVGAPGAGGLYPDGAPTPTSGPLIATYGDGTVPRHSALGGGVAQHASFVDPTKKAGHAGLMDTYAYDICQFLNNGTPCSATVAEGAIEPQGPQSTLAISIAGRVQPYLTGPNGFTCGIDPNTGELANNTSNASAEIMAGNAGIAVTEPAPGEYELAISAVPDEVFSVEVQYAEPTSAETLRFWGIFHENAVSCRITVNPTIEPRVALVGLVSAPASVRTERIGDLTRVAWDASPDPNVSGYNVYARPDDQPKFALLGSSSGTTFDTAHPWNASVGGQAWQYFVVAAAADGAESFFTETVENRNPLIARLSSDVTGGVEPLAVAFADASSGEVSAWAWDFDSDGVIDSTAQNPTHTYPSAGSYTVTLTVGGPEGTDTTIRVGFITVEPTEPPPPPVPGDFDGDGDVDLMDWAAFQERMKAPSEDPTLAGWYIFDLDSDHDVDLSDWSRLQKLMTGP